jgi:hypothetical protein
LANLFHGGQDACILIESTDSLIYLSRFFEFGARHLSHHDDDRAKISAMPPHRIRHLVRALAVALGFVALAVCWWYVLESKRPVDAANIVSGVLAPIALVAAGLATIWRISTRIDASAVRASDLLSAADAVSMQVSLAWRDEAARRRLTVPATISVKWRQIDHGSRVGAVSTVVSGSGPLPFPSVSERAEVLTQGVLARLHDAYLQLPHGRLVLLGAPGTGKTGALVLLLLAACRYREDLTDHERRRVPVPLLVSLTGWEPDTQDLLSWIEQSLQRDHPYLLSGSYGPAVPGRLLREGYFALFLDGLDEMPTHVRPAALHSVATNPGIRIVLTSRISEYEEAILHSSMARSAVVELMPVEPDKAAEYLLSEQTPTKVEEWAKVAARIQSDPDGALARALSTPLLLTLARGTYEITGNPTELLDEKRFASEAEVRSHLLDRLVTTAYSSEELPLARRFLATVAQAMNAHRTRDLEWWKLRKWFAPWAAPLITSLVFAGMAAIITALLGGVLAGLVVGVGWLVGACPTSIALFVGWSARNPVPLTGIIPRTLGSIGAGALGIAIGLLYLLARGELGDVRQEFLGALVLGVVQGFVVAMAGLHESPLRASLHRPEPRDLVSGFIAGATAGLLIFPMTGLAGSLGIFLTGFLGSIVALSAVRIRPSKTPEGMTPQTSFYADLRASAVFSIFGGCVIGVAFWLVLQPVLSVRMTLLVSAVGGIGGAAVGYLTSSQGLALLISTQVLWMRGLAPPSVMRFFREARERQVLRQVGAAYQFRHAELQDQFSRTS